MCTYYSQLYHNKQNKWILPERTRTIAFRVDIIRFWAKYGFKKVTNLISLRFWSNSPLFRPYIHWWCLNKRQTDIEAVVVFFFRWITQKTAVKLICKSLSILIKKMHVVDSASHQVLYMCYTSVPSHVKKTSTRQNWFQFKKNTKAPFEISCF